jgi:hypothetical protein
VTGSTSSSGNILVCLSPILLLSSLSFDPLRMTRFVVGLKYIINHQTFEVSYEGLKRRFEVVAVSSKGLTGHAVDTLSHGLETLSLNSKPQIWMVTWDTKISESSIRPQQTELRGPHKASIICGIIRFPLLLICVAIFSS